MIKKININVWLGFHKSTETLRIYTKIKFSKKIESVLVTTVKKKKGNRDLPGLISEETLLQV